MLLFSLVGVYRLTHTTDKKFMEKEMIDMSEFMPGGAYIVGTTAETGRKLTDGRVYGDEANMAKSILKEMQKKGESIQTPTIATKTKKGSKKNKADKPSDTAIPTVYNNGNESRTEIILVSPLGKIKMNVAKVLDSDRAMILVFANDTDLNFEPNVGDDLKILWGGREYPVMYPGVIFRWTDGLQKLMLFFKSNE